MGSHSYRVKECAQRRRLFLRWAVAIGVWLCECAGDYAVGLLIVLLSSRWLPSGMGKIKAKVKFRQLFSKSPEINILSAARFFLFGARDVWFVVGLPVFLYSVLNWSFEQGRRLSGNLGDWLWPSTVTRANAAKAVWLRATAGGRDDSLLDRVFDCDSRSDHLSPPSRSSGSADYHHWPDAFWDCFCLQLSRPFISSVGLHRRRQSSAECGFLLHG